MSALFKSTRVPGERGGKYRTDSGPDDRIRRLVQVGGVTLILAGLYFGAVAFAVL